MKNLKIYGILSLVELACLGTACNDDSIFSGSDGEGKLSLNLSVSQVIKTSTGGSRSDKDNVAPRAKTIDASDLEITLVSKDGTRKYSVDPQKTAAYPVGEYILTAKYGDENDEGFDLPYYYGEADVTIEENKTTQAALTAALGNSMFQVHYTESAQKYFQAYSTVFVSEVGNDVVYPSDATDHVYIHSGNVAVYADVTLPNGKSGRVGVATVEAQPQYAYDITVDVKGGSGDATLSVSFDDDLIEENISLDLGDELSSQAAPKWTTIGFENGKDFTSVESVPFPGDLKMGLVARGGIKSVTMKTDNNLLLGPRWPSNVDLTAATAEQQENLADYGFKCLGLYKNPDQMAVLDFTEVLPNLKTTYTTNHTVNFTIEAIDKNGKSGETVVLTINLEPLTLNISSTPRYVSGATEVTFKLAYNGYDITKAKFSYINDRGTYSVSSNATAVNNGDNTYNITMTVPASTSIPKVMVEVGDKSSEADVDNYAITYSENDVWATKMAVKFGKLGGTDLSSTVTGVMISTDGSTYSNATWKYADGKINITGLAAKASADTYYVKVKDANGEYGPVKIKLEDATQIPNGDMESWCITDKGNNWKLYYPGTSAVASVWGTNNPMTTSQGVDFAYCRVSGTIETDDKHGGSKAALIRTIGWGSGNTNAGSWSVMKYGDAGLLHLGSSRTSRPSGYGDQQGALTTDDLNCGMTFASRPTSLSFWYKYSPKNSSDNGLAEVYVYDALGNVLATATATLNSASSYTQKTLTLSYASASIAKAAKIYVKFLSSNNRDYLKKDSSNFSWPGDSSARIFLGSQLYIDDITLNY